MISMIKDIISQITSKKVPTSIATPIQSKSFIQNFSNFLFIVLSLG